MVVVTVLVLVVLLYTITWLFYRLLRGGRIVGFTDSNAFQLHSLCAERVTDLAVEYCKNKGRALKPQTLDQWKVQKRAFVSESW